MEIANPVAGALPTYDGFWHLAKPTLKGVLVPADIAVTIAHETTDPFDLTPQSSYDLTIDDIAGTCLGGAPASTQSQWQYDVTGTNLEELCIENWTIGMQGKSCVKVEAFFYRPLAAASTDAECDLTIDKSDHEISIQMGSVGEADTTPFKFTETVSFGTFSTLAGSNVSGAIDLIPSLAMGITSIIVMNF